MTDTKPTLKPTWDKALGDSFKDEIKKQWPKLTDTDLEHCDSEDALASRVALAYQISSYAAAEEVKTWLDIRDPGRLWVPHVPGTWDAGDKTWTAVKAKWPLITDADRPRALTKKGLAALIEDRYQGSGMDQLDAWLATQVVPDQDAWDPKSPLWAKVKAKWPLITDQDHPSNKQDLADLIAVRYGGNGMKKLDLWLATNPLVEEKPTATTTVWPAKPTV